MRRSLLAPLATALAAALAGPGAAAAHADGTLTITGAGFGHGVGMSQYGALGFAQHGFGYRDILHHYYTGTQIGHAAPSSVVRVLLAAPRVASFTGADRAAGVALRPDRVYRVAPGPNGSLVLQDAAGHRLAGVAAPLRATGPGPLTLQGPSSNGLSGGRYRGWFEFRRSSSGGVLAIDAVGLEQYVAGVVSAESPSSWPLAALEAQAVAARTYALTTKAGGSFDQYPDQRSQMYRGVAAERPSTNQAVNGTRGELVTYGGRPVTTFFFSTSGGRTENVEDSFLGSSPRPWLRSVDDPFDSVSPVHRWGPVVMTLGRATAALSGLVKGDLQGITVDQRGASPRVMYATLVGSRGTTRVTGSQLRWRLGLRDSWMYLTAITTQVAPAPAPGSGGAQGARSGGPALTGRVLPARAGALVRVQRRAGARWVAAGSTRVGSRGGYRASVAGAGLYRVVSGAAAGPAVRVR